ncbi:MAG: NAD-dependent DNA ligase LigA [Spirochaetes bacterium]|nr:NAD-dependent DNA ligase LigA [Spirochaetota bacterium]
MAGKKDRVGELERLISYHQDRYYNGHPEISDAEFDALWDELAALDRSNPLLARVGADFADGFPKARHLLPMGSQEKASDPEAFIKWAVKAGHGKFLVQYKLDGASIELQYADGFFRKAVTRGNGEIGDDITPNAARMRGVLPTLPARFTGGVRGEVMMTRDVHDALYPDKANCRNAANGLMKRKDGSGSENLRVMVYDAESSDLASPFATETSKMEWLSRMGFETVPMTVCDGPDSVIEHRAHVMDMRESLQYDIDGLVVKGDEIDPADMRRARPEKQIAFKFSLEEAVSTVCGVEWSESGSLYTPIGIVEPVRLAGTTVQRANLCNPGLIRAMDLRIGSRVVITKRGEIIPKIECLVENPPDAVPIGMPGSCSCGTALVDEGTRLYCPNPACPKRILHRVEKWLSVLDVRDFGPVVVRKLFDSGRISSIPDLYGIGKDELAGYERMGPTLAAKILRNLRVRSRVSLAAFIAGFDIEGIGETIAQKAVSAGFDTLEKLRSATVEDLSLIEGFGDITAAAFVAGLSSACPEMDALLASGMVTISPPVAGGPLSGMSFCFTGELRSIKRSEAEALVKSSGGQTRSSVSKGLSFLVTNDTGSGSDKNRKAGKLGIPVIDEGSFLKLAKDGVWTERVPGGS